VTSVSHVVAELETARLLPDVVKGMIPPDYAIVYRKGHMLRPLFWEGPFFRI